MMKHLLNHFSLLMGRYGFCCRVDSSSLCGSQCIMALISRLPYSKIMISHCLYFAGIWFGGDGFRCRGDSSSLY